MATFVLVALLSVPPTLQYLKWRRSSEAPGPADVGRVKRFLYAEVFLFAFLPIFAATMARGFGEF